MYLKAIYTGQLQLQLLSTTLLPRELPAACSYLLPYKPDPLAVYLHSCYHMITELAVPHDRKLCKGYLLEFFQTLKYLPLPGKIDRYRDTISLVLLTYRQSTAPTVLHSLAPFHQPVLLIRVPMPALFRTSQNYIVIEFLIDSCRIHKCTVCSTSR